MATNAFNDLKDYEKKLNKYVKTRPEKRDAGMLNDLLSSNYSFDDNLSDSARLQIEQLRKNNNNNSNTSEPVEGPKTQANSLLDGQLTTAQYNTGNMPVRKTVPGTAVTDKPDIAGLVAKAKEGKASQEDLEIMGQAEKDNPGILAENGAGRITIQAAEDAVNGKEVPPAEKNAKTENKTDEPKPDNSGIDEMYNKFREINAKKAGYNDLPVSFKDFQDNLQYRSIYSDFLDFKDSHNALKEARAKDEVRTQAKTYAEQLKEISDKGNSIIAQKEKLEEDLKNANSKIDKRIIQNTIKLYEQELSNLENKWEKLTNIPMSKIDDNDYLISIGVDPDHLDELAKDAGVDLSGFMGNVKDTQEKISYLKNEIKDDVATIMNPNASDEEINAANEKIDKILPELRKHVENDLNISKGTLPALRKVAENIGDPDLTEMLDNIEGMTHLFEDQNKMLLTEENMSKVIETMNELDDIVKHQEEYNADTRYARDARLSAFNKLMFDVFDRLKTDLVFLAAVEFENPQMMRSALDDFNYKLEAAENKRQTDKFGAYTDNRIREITQDNLSKFKQITEVEPALKQLEGQINLESRQGRAQMQSLINAWDEYQKQMSTLGADEKVSFASWIAQNSGNGNPISQVIGTLLNNLPQITDLINKAAALVPNTNSTTPTSSSGKLKEDIENVSSGKEKKTSKWLDNATSKLSKQKNEEEKKPDPVLTMDVQNTVNQALASRAAPPQGAAPQAGAPKTNNGFGRTNLA